MILLQVLLVCWELPRSSSTHQSKLLGLFLTFAFCKGISTVNLGKGEGGFEQKEKISHEKRHFCKRNLNGIEVLVPTLVALQKGD